MFVKDCHVELKKNICAVLLLGNRQTNRWMDSQTLPPCKAFFLPCKATYQGGQYLNSDILNVWHLIDCNDLKNIHNFRILYCNP